MKILLINGNPKPENNKFEEYLHSLIKELNSLGHETVTLTLRDMTINNCVGCYSCWVKTPGVCIFKDSGPQMLIEMLKSDVVIYASPVIMGFISSLLKTAQERILPLGHPYLFIKDNRLQHVLRYDKYPAAAVLLDTQADDSDLKLIENIFKGGRTKTFLFTKTMSSDVKEVAHALNNI